VGHTLAGIHAVRDARTQTAPEIKKKYYLYQIKANEMGMDEKREIKER
jgi:hypothetical protein